jgi:hypothetical protein
MLRCLCKAGAAGGGFSGGAPARGERPADAHSGPLRPGWLSTELQSAQAMLSVGFRRHVSKCILRPRQHLVDDGVGHHSRHGDQAAPRKVRNMTRHPARLRSVHTRHAGHHREGRFDERARGEPAPPGSELMVWV